MHSGWTAKKTFAAGQWYDVVVHARWSMGDDGFYQMWVNGKQTANDTGSNSFYNGEVAFRYGLYRYDVWAYNGEGPLPTQVVYFDSVRRSSTRSGLYN